MHLETTHQNKAKSMMLMPQSHASVSHTQAQDVQLLDDAVAPFMP